MKKKIIISIIFMLSSISFLNAQNTNIDDSLQIIPYESSISTCGNISEYILEQQQSYITYKNAIEQQQLQLFEFEPVSSFPPEAIMDCGKFKLFFEDYGTDLGFFDLEYGQDRRNTFCAVLNYIESTINITSPDASIKVLVKVSVNSTDDEVNFAGRGGSYYPDDIVTTQGIYTGYTHTQIVSNMPNPDVEAFECHVKMNFGNSDGEPILYYNDYNNIVLGKRLDLFTVLLHEMTHSLGFLSFVTDEESVPHNAISETGVNSFSLYDWTFGYIGNMTNSGNFISQKIVIDFDTPHINPQINVVDSPLRSFNVWLNKNNPPHNHAMAGKLGSPQDLTQPPSISHLGIDYNFHNASQYCPGHQQKHVMAPSSNYQELKREWSMGELRVLLALGYSLNPTFASSNSLNGIDNNEWLLTSNRSPYRNDYYTNPSTGTVLYSETSVPDYTIINTPGVELIHQISSSSAVDLDGDNITVMPGTLFGIRGVGSGNNHDRLTLSSDNSQVIFTPEEGYIGRAQFGYNLWDGHEKGALVIVTIEVTKDPNYIVPVGEELVINGSFEDATEIWTQENLTAPYKAVEYSKRGKYNMGNILAGGHPYSFLSNFNNFRGGIITKHSYDNASDVAVDVIVGQIASCSNSSPSPSPEDFPFPSSPYPDSNFDNNIRYSRLNYRPVYSTLKTPLEPWHYYNFSCYVSFSSGAFSSTNFEINEDVNLTLDIIEEPVYDFLNDLNVIQSLTEVVVVNDVNNNTYDQQEGEEKWQEVNFSFYYCGEDPSNFISLISDNSKSFVVDNISIKEIATTIFNTTEIATNTSNYSNQIITFASDLVIPNGVTLIIDNSTLLFDQDAGITIEEGGYLTITNTELKEQDCSDYWQGIEVFGIPTQYQDPNPNNGYGHGRVRLLSGTIVRNAYYGVVNGARGNNYWNPAHSGGKIKTDGASFINCKEAVRIQKYTSTGSFPLHCRFFNTNFTWDDDYPFWFMGPMINMVYAKKVEIKGCNFSNTREALFANPNLNYQHAAIYMNKSSIKMDADINDSRMVGFNYGIVNFSKTASSIRNTDFKNYRSIWFYKNKTSRITENTFTNMTQNLENLTGSVNIYDPVWQAHYGIYMEYSSGFWIEDNVLNFPLNNVREAGIIVRASGETYNQLYDNDFQNCYFGVIAFDDNMAPTDLDGLNLLCNNFNNNHDDVWIDHIAPEQYGWGISSKQGSGAVSAGNQFGTVLDQGFKIDNYLDHIDYFRVSSEDIEQPETDGDVTILTANDVNQCASNVNKSKEEKKMDALAYKNEALLFRTQLDNLVDGGDTDALTNEVLYADYTEALELYYELMSKSPNLSLKVMEEAIDKEYTLPPALLTLILQSNPTAGKSSKLQSKLDDRLIPLSEYQRYMIDQGKNLISEKEYLEAKLAYNELNFISLMNQAINLIVFDDEITEKESEIDFLLSGYKEVEHHYMKIDRALANQDYSLAQSILDNIPVNFSLRTRQDQEWIDYQVCYQLLIELEQNNTNSLTDIQIDNLMIIAEKHSNSAAGLAWQMLGQYDAAYVLEGMIAPGSNTKSLARNGKKEEINPFDELQYIRVFPNPVDKIAILEFVGYETQLSIILMDSNGKLILSQIVSGNKLQEVLNLGEYANGLYNLTISDINLTVIYRNYFKRHI